MVAASFVGSGDPVVSDSWLVDTLSPLAGSVPRLFSIADASEVQVTTLSGGDVAAAAAMLVKVVRDLFLIRHEERLAYLVELGDSPQDVQRTFALVESWLQSGVRREVMRFAAGAAVAGMETAFGQAFHEWFEDQPAKDLVNRVMNAGLLRTDLALAYALCELCDDLRAACNLAFLRQHAPDWESVPVLPEDIQEYSLDKADFALDAETWPVY